LAATGALTNSSRGMI